MSTIYIEAMKRGLAQGLARQFVSKFKESINEGLVFPDDLNPEREARLDAQAARVAIMAARELMSVRDNTDRELMEALIVELQKIANIQKSES